MYIKDSETAQCLFPEKRSNLFFVIGGDDGISKTAEVFDFHGGKRHLLPDMRHHRSKVAAVALDGEVYALGALLVLLHDSVAPDNESMWQP